MATATECSRATAQLAMLLLLLVVVAREADGAPKAVRLRVGDNDPACPWRVALVGNERVEHCVNEVVFKFSAPPSLGWALPKEASTDPKSSEHGAPAGYAPLSGVDGVADGGGNWYKLHRRGRPWSAAKAECEREGAHLVVLNSNAETAGVRALIDQQDALRGFSSHAGFYMEIVSEQGESLPSMLHERWIRGDEDAPACGQMDADGFLFLGKCRDEEPFVCEFETSTDPTDPTKSSPHPRPSESTTVRSFETATAFPYPHEDTESASDKQRIPGGYKSAPGWNGSVYRMDSTDNPFSLGYCNDGRLAVFETEQEVEAVIDFFQEEVREDRSVDGVRVGLRSGEPKTILGGSVNETGYDRWITKEKEQCFLTDIKLLLHATHCSSIHSNKYCLYEFSMTK